MTKVRGASSGQVSHNNRVSSAAMMLLPPPVGMTSSGVSVISGCVIHHW